MVLYVLWYKITVSCERIIQVTVPTDRSVTAGVHTEEGLPSQQPKMLATAGVPSEERLPSQQPTMLATAGVPVKRIPSQD